MPGRDRLLLRGHCPPGPHPLQGRGLEPFEARPHLQVVRQVFLEPRTSGISPGGRPRGAEESHPSKGPINQTQVAAGAERMKKASRETMIVNCT